mgnify:CR=1 FL=1
MTDQRPCSMPPYRLVGAEGPPSPFVVASPHSGRYYPSHFRRLSRLPLKTLRRSEDCYVDHLAAGAPAHGMPLLTAVYPRSYIDLNRASDDLDPLLFETLPPDVRQLSQSDRVSAGLGVLARVVATDMPIYRKPLPFSEATRRIRALYRPYHAQLDALLTAAEGIHGWSCLIDLHSMPSTHAAGASSDMRLPDIVLGDRFGQSCAPAMTMLAEDRFRALGYSVSRNQPYAGGYCTLRHGRPVSGRHALQIEINRALYMDEESLAPTPALAQVAGDIGQVLESLRELDLSGPIQQAAE